MMKLSMPKNMVLLLCAAAVVAFVLLYKPSDAPAKASSVQPVSEGLTEQPATVEESSKSAMPQPKALDKSLLAKDLLPKEDKNAIEFAGVPPASGSLSEQNFLTAGHLQGELTMASKNANYGLRAEPPNPQKEVSPWMNTSIKPDHLRRPLC